MEKRILFLDFFRGFAILHMIFWQIFDFFAKVNIYSTPPFYSIFLGMPVNGIGVGFFAFISGFSIYLSINKRKEEPKSQIINHLFKRYGTYILLALILSLWAFNFSTFYMWNEAVQGIALSALIAGILLISFKSVYPPTIFAIIIIMSQKFLRDLALNYPSLNIILNPLFNGFFSLAHLLPISLAGALIAYLYLNFKKDKFLNYSLWICLITLLHSLFAHILTTQINYDQRSSSYLTFIIGISILFLLVTYLIIKQNPFSEAISLFGQTALFAYFVHFALIFKPLQLIGLTNIFSTTISVFIAIILTIMLYFLSKEWLKLKEKNKWKLVF